MSKNNPFSQGPMRFRCRACDEDCGSRLLILSSQRQHCEYSNDGETVETVVDGAKGLGEWCESCGSEHAIEDLKSRGITAVPVADFPGDQTCAKCLQTVVKHTEPHTAYVLELDEIDGHAITPLEFLFESRVCSACTGGAS